MKRQSRRSAVDEVSAALRELSFSVPEDTCLGSEEELVTKLGAGRNTVRQAARLLEREGVLHVRRGTSGGYFAARPDLGTIEHAVSAYLTSMAVTVKDVTYVASLLWAEVVRRAARQESEAARSRIEALLAKVEAVTAAIDFQTIMDLEQEIRAAVFAITGSAYIELIFQINYSFAQGDALRDGLDVPQHDPDFPARWRKGKLMELNAILDGDEKLAELAAHHSRNIWHERFWGKAP